MAKRLSVFVDIQHAGKPQLVSDKARSDDRGAVYDGVTEVEYTSRLAWEIDKRLLAAGHTSYVTSFGEYSARAAAADAVAADVYLALHFDSSASGRPDRGTVYYDCNTRPGRGDVLASKVAAAVSKVVPWKVSPAPTRSGERAYNTIKHTSMPALCLELYFVNGLQVDKLMGLLPAIADAIVDGISEYAG